MKQMRVIERAAVAAVVLFLGASLVPLGGSSPEPVASPSYEALRPLLQAGDGKGLDQGVIDLFQVHSSPPTGWIWVKDDTTDGSGTEYRVFHSSFVHPSADDDNVTIEFDFVPNYEPQNLTDFLSWIVQRSPHVNNASELEVHEYTVSTVE